MPEQDIQGIRAAHVVAESGKVSEFLQQLHWLFEEAQGTNTVS